MQKSERNKVRCPRCGYEMPIFQSRDALCRGLWVRCKGRGCGHEFEIKIPEESK